MAQHHSNEVGLRQAQTILQAPAGKAWLKKAVQHTERKLPQQVESLEREVKQKVGEVARQVRGLPARPEEPFGPNVIQIGQACQQLGAMGSQIAQCALMMGGHGRTWQGVQMGCQGLMQFGQCAMALPAAYAAAIAPGAGLMAGASLMCTGIGAVAGLVMVGVAIFGNNGGGDNGIGSALQAIMQQMQQIMQQIQKLADMVQKGFERTWKILEQMDKTAQKRFELTLKAIRMVYDELHAQAEAHHIELKGILTQMDGKLDTYLSYLTDDKVIRTIDNMKSTVVLWEKPLEDLRRWVIGENIDIGAVFAKWDTNIYAWLAAAANLDPRTGKISLMHDGRLDITSDALLGNLLTAISPANQETRDIKLGLLASLAYMHGERGLYSQTIIHPQNWDYVASLYRNLYRGLVIQGIQQGDLPRNTLDHIGQLITLAQTNREVLATMANSKALWESLVINYQAHFDELKRAIEEAQLQPAEGRTVPEGIRWDLTITFEENWTSFREVSLSIDQLTWLGSEATRIEHDEPPYNDGK